MHSPLAVHLKCSLTVLPQRFRKTLGQTPRLSSLFSLAIFIRPIHGVMRRGINEAHCQWKRRESDENEPREWPQFEPEPVASLCITAWVLQAGCYSAHCKLHTVCNESKWTQACFDSPRWKSFLVFLHTLSICVNVQWFENIRAGNTAVVRSREKEASLNCQTFLKMLCLKIRRESIESRFECLKYSGKRSNEW